MACLCACGFASCESVQQPQPSLPTLESIRTDTDDAGDDDNAIATPEHQGVLVVQKLLLPIDVPTDEAWAVVDEARFPPLTRGVWNGNGLRIGLLSRDAVQTFSAMLPAPLNISSTQLATSEHPAVLLQSRRLRGQIHVDLTIPPFATREVRVTGGWLRLLVNTKREDAGLAVQLTPQHHVPTHSFDARSPLEKQLDGRLFHELSVSLASRPENYLVLGLYRPWPATPDVNEQQAADAEASATQPGAPEPPTPQASPAVPPLPPHLGHAVCTQRWLGQEAQVLLVVSWGGLDWAEVSIQ